MTLFQTPLKLAALFALSTTFGCAHYYYTAEVGGPGAKADIKTHVGAIYLIPPESSQLKMKVLSLGVQKDEKKNATLRMRLYFVRRNVAGSDPGAKQNTTLEYIDPREQAVVIPGDTAEIHPSQIFGNPEKKPLVELLPNQKQVIELLFPLPANIKTEAELQSFTFSWKVHYTRHQSEQQITRFDRQDTTPMNHAEFQTDPDYPDFPIHEFMAFPSNYEWVPYFWPWWWY